MKMVHIFSVSTTIKQLFLCFLIAAFHDLACADPPYKLCPQNTNYAADSPFEHNLDNLFRSLPSNTSIPKFFNSSVGHSSDTVYGLYMCLNYIQTDDRKTCIEIASQDGNIPKFNVKNVSESERYKSVVKKILSNLTKAAAFDPSTEMYATGNVSFTDTDTLYALVQCTRDLSAHDCNSCLETAIADISSCCYFSRGARLLSRSCYLRYELYAFYEGVTEPAATDENRATGKGEAQVNIQVQSNNSRDHNRTDFHDQHVQGTDDPKAWEFYIDLETIHVATDSFSDSNILGQGGFVPVYKVMEKANGFEMHWCLVL
ncbi:hypothetical protein Patl1_11016 [Pistacia atlantica]|uniref:Uncharacterized protein n=1 Tax=Pistacia atlantica TaxID=434234 RepID=A0ACC1A0E1_9ROSI|nr:hypothetical protein Patl1_11016 [Pistacia atlantica]